MEVEQTMIACGHKPVLLSEALAVLSIRPSGVYVDCTFGCGGHSQAILEKLDAHGRLLAIDRDKEAIEIGRQEFANDPRMQLYHGSFSELSAWTERQGVKGAVDGVILDLGVSSKQLDVSERGFSFLRDGPLDMRMNVDQNLTAEQWLSAVDEPELRKILWEYGEERYARRVAEAICRERSRNPIRTTGQLASIIASAIPYREKGQHPATRSFQAIRIWVNRELEELEKVLPQLLDVLVAGGRFAVISFHSLEDRMVKRFIRKHEKPEALPYGLPPREPFCQRLRSMGKVIKPSKEECIDNPRARSAVLRAAEKVL